MKGKIFNAQKVQAIISGNAVMFREVIKPQPKFQSQYVINAIRLIEKCPYKVGQKIFCKESFLQKIGSTQLPSGEHETFFTGSKVEYVVDGAQERWVNPDAYYSDYWKKRPAQHMKQEHSRLTLEITDIRVERLNEISEEDAIKEGVDKLFTEEEMKHVLRVHPTETNEYYKNYLWHGHIGKTITSKQSDESQYQYSSYKKARDSFSSLWNATHKKPEEKFEANPWIFAYSFEVVTC